MKQGFAGALGAPQGNPQEALQQLTQILHVVSSVHNEATYQVAKQQFAQMGGNASELSPHYKKLEVDNFKKILIKGINHLADSQPQQPQQGLSGALTQAPAPQEG